VSRAAVSGGSSSAPLCDKSNDEIYYSDDDEPRTEASSGSGPGSGSGSSAGHSPGSQSLSSTSLASVTNPFGWKALWVGNLGSNTKQDVVQKMFSKFGRLTHCGLYTKADGAFALIHYDNAESPRMAMSEYQGAVIRGVSLNNKEPLVLRFRPNKDQKKEKYQDRLDIQECYYWRTTGCKRGEGCHFNHIPANQGVDIQPWMLNAEGKPRAKDGYNTFFN
jgi:RNA recognition motif-containing protein